MEFQKKNNKNTIYLNISFVVVGLAIILVLLNAPNETTAKLPMDESHTKFHTIKSKKEAEKFCTECHIEEGVAPLPADHPPKYRCLFCHKRQ